jgi:hypothetical protein
MPEPEGGESFEQHLAARDEVLQVMYWLRGEGIAKDVVADDLTRWMSVDVMQIQSILVGLAEANLVEIVLETEVSTPRFRLTQSGVKEGGRRFADEFADLTKPGHFECADPHCECKLTGNPADCTHQH